MTKNQILDNHAHLLRANFQQTMAASSFADPNSEVGDYLIDMSVCTFNRLVHFYEDNKNLFNEEESGIMNNVLEIWDNAGESLTTKEADALTDIQCELYDYYNGSIDEDGYFNEDEEEDLPF